MTSLEDMMKGRPIHPETIPILHPKFKGLITPLAIPIGIIYFGLNLFIGFLPTMNMLGSGSTKRDVMEAYEYFDKNISLIPISTITTFGREAAFYFHEEKSPDKYNSPQSLRKAA
ncbi:hypothetical protein HY212_03420 [Candidatus Pacearchaeota archaeon]|nr:hypothetical protein [Candidatus Pacearchaeota archaeon]